MSVCVLCVCSDDDMISLASMMSVSNLSTIGFLEDEDDDYYWSVHATLWHVRVHVYGVVEPSLLM